MYKCFAHIFVCAYIPGDQKRVLDALELELHTLETAIWVLGIKLWESLQH